MLCKYVFIAPAFIILFLLGSYIPLNAQETEVTRPVIKKVEVKGNQRISSATVKSAVKIKEGDMYDPQAMSQDVDAIWLLGFFDNIEVEVEPYEDGIKLVFLVTERPVIKDIIFIGNVEIKTNKLEKAVELRRGDYLKHYLQKLGEDKIRDLYQKKGFHLVDVKSEEKKANGYANVIYNINEGLKAHIEKIDIVGNKTFTDKRLLKVFSTKRRKFPSFVFPGRLDTDKFNEDIEKVKAFYVSGGWLDADVKWKTKHGTDKSRMLIDVFIDEGERYYVDTITIKGNKLFTDAEIRSLLELKKEDAFLPEILQKDSQSIRSTYGRQGHINTNVKASHTYKPVEPKIDLTYDIQEGERIFIEKVIISGNDKTKDNVIRRSLLFFPGERLDTEKIRISKDRLNNTGYFDNESGSPTDISFEPGTKPNTKNVIVSVKEGRTGIL